jgi:large subunit ribosomal protein L17
MRHLVKGRKLGRKVPHRKATLQSLSIALIKNHRIVTTVAKAKELRTFVEPLITRAKEDNQHNRRQVFSTLKDKEAVDHLFAEVAQKAKDRPGGYTRVVKAGFRSGDSAEMAVIELVDYNDIKPEGSTAKKKRTRRAGKSNKPTDSEKEPEKKTENKQETADNADEGSGAESEESSDSEESSEDKK